MKEKRPWYKHWLAPFLIACVLVYDGVVLVEKEPISLGVFFFIGAAVYFRVTIKFYLEAKESADGER